MTISSLIPNLNLRAAELMNSARERAAVLGLQRLHVAGAEILDFGVAASGGLEAGQLLSCSCLADPADVSMAPPEGNRPLPRV